MKISMLLVLAALLSVGSASAQSYYEFAGYLRGTIKRVNTNEEPVLSALPDGRSGGMLTCTMPDATGQRYGVYQFQWEFLDDINTLVPGRQYRVRMTGARIEGNAEHNSAYVSLKGSGEVTQLAKDQNYESPGAAIQMKTKASPVYIMAPSHSFVADAVITVQEPGDTRAWFSFDFTISGNPYSSTSPSLTFSLLYAYEPVAVKR